MINEDFLEMHMGHVMHVEFFDSIKNKSEFFDAVLDSQDEDNIEMTTPADYAKIPKKSITKMYFKSADRND